jgi:uncharacterized protein
VILTDVNVLVAAYRPELPVHSECAGWLTEALASDASFGLSELVLSAFLRIVTHPRIFEAPAPIEQALEFTDALSARPNAVRVAPGERHWGVFTRLCRAVDAKGNTIPDAYLAALAIEWGAEWTTLDRGFARFPGLHWKHPLAD